MLIVLTASPWQDQQSLDWLQSVQQARNWGIEIYSAGFGPSVRLPQLTSVVRHPERDAYIMSSFDDPDQTIRKFVNEIARGECDLFTSFTAVYLLTFAVSKSQRLLQHKFH